MDNTLNLKSVFFLYAVFVTKFCASINTGIGKLESRCHQEHVGLRD